MDFIINEMEYIELMDATSPYFNPSSGSRLHLEYKKVSAGSDPIPLTRQPSGLTPPCSWPQKLHFDLFLAHI